MPTNARKDPDRPMHSPTETDGLTLEAARAALAATFGYRDFRPGQAEVIGHLLAGRSAAAVFPTGGGKSLCYQIPALLLPGLTLVVSPLIALMKDQIDQLARRGVAAARLDSTLTAQEVRDLMDRIRAGSLRLLYVAPERFGNERFRESISRVRIALFAVDEAHCVSEWGHNFRPDYLKLAGYGRLCGAERTLALTATATPAVLDDIRRSFEIAPECAVRTGFHRENLTLEMTPVRPAERDGLLLARLREGKGPAIVYVTQQRTAEEVAAALDRAGLAARAYHAGMEDDERARVQDWFLGSPEAVVVATIAFGMGIDKADIRRVIHYNLPKSLENLAQEIGRAGRDGLPARCETLVCTDDLLALRNFAYGDTPDLGSVHALLEGLLTAAEVDGEMTLSLHDLSTRHDIRLLVVRTLLTYLELSGHLAAGTPIYAEYEFRPLLPVEEILGRFAGERREFLRAVFQQAKKAKIWFHIDLEAAARALSTPRDRLVRALDYLAGEKLLEVRAAGLRYPYRWLHRPADPQQIEGMARSLHARTLERESREIARLDQVLALAAQESCQTAALAAHFGETLPHPCGHCSWCLNGGRPAALFPPTPVYLDEDRLRQAMDLCREGGPRELVEALTGPRACARFLAGLPSPRLRGKLKSHPLQGAFAHVPFADLLQRLRSIESSRSARNSASL